MRSRYPYRPAASHMSYSFGPGPWTPVIKALIIANVVAFLATWIAGPSFDVIGLLGLRPYAVIHGYIWQIATYLFLHAGVWHLTFNMLALWMFGVDLERGWGSK